MYQQLPNQQHASNDGVAEPPGCHGFGEVPSREEDVAGTPSGDQDMEFDFLDQDFSAYETLLDIPFRVGQRNRSSYYVVFAAFLAALGGVLFGYDVGIVSGALLPLSRDFGLSCFYQELVVSSMLLGALIASLFGGFLVDFCGRRVTIIGNDIIFIFGAVVLAFAPNFSILIFGRFIVGFAVSLSAIAECVYISEIAPAAKRGMLVSLNELGITMGFLLAYLVNYAFINQEQGWRYMFGLSVIPAVLQGIGMVFLPKSPRFLMIRGCEEQARQTLMKIRGTEDVDDELHSIRTTNNSQKPGSALDLCRSRDNMRLRFIIGMGLVIFQQVTGQPSVLYYAPTIFLEVGFDNDAAAVFATVGLGFVKVICTIISLLCVDRAGRCKFLQVGTVMMVLGVTSIGITALSQQTGKATGHCQTLPQAYVSPNHRIDLSQSVWGMNASKNEVISTHPRRSKREHGLAYPFRMPTKNATKEIQLRPVDFHIKWLSFGALVLYIAGYALGFGPVTWLVLSEIFPSHIRGRAISMATVGNWGANLVISLTFLNLMNTLTLPGTFFMYSIICVFAILFIHFMVPETKGKSLEEISLDFNQNSRSGRMGCYPCSKQSRSRSRSRFTTTDGNLYEPVTVRND